MVGPLVSRNAEITSNTTSNNGLPRVREQTACQCQHDTVRSATYLRPVRCAAVDAGGLEGWRRKLEVGCHLSCRVVSGHVRDVRNAPEKRQPTRQHAHTIKCHKKRSADTSTSKRPISTHSTECDTEYSRANGRLAQTRTPTHLLGKLPRRRHDQHARSAAWLVAGGAVGQELLDHRHGEGQSLAHARAGSANQILAPSDVLVRLRLKMG